MITKLRNLILGKPREVTDPEVFHNVSLVAFLAWVGLGADGLSSSAYGPDEAYRALLEHGPNFAHLAILLVVMTTLTVAVISIAYSNLIEHFPGGGGGYLVATKLLGKKVGVVSGCALLVDYVLTITTSVAGACDAIWSYLPASAAQLNHAGLSGKLWIEFLVLAFLVVLNLRGVKESVTFLAPIFIVFIVTHAAMLVYAFASHLTDLPGVFSTASTEIHGNISSLGFFPVAFILMRAYSMGGGTYTGIEAVSNGVSMLREPRVKTGKRTMLLMAVSLAVTAGGILFSYLLTHSVPDADRIKTMNAVLLENLYGNWHLGSFAIGKALVILTLTASALLLFVAAQTGFLDGPRVLANMAVDSWMPHRFAQLSDKLVTHNGVYLMGAAAAGVLLYTKGNITMLITMYSINVFITFSLTELGMARHWITDRKKEPKWKSLLAIHGTGLIMCLSILTIILIEKFHDGGYVTIGVTGTVIAGCFLVRRHYKRVNGELKRLDDILTATPMPDRAPLEPRPIERMAPTAVITVGGFSGFGLHQILSIQKLFPNYFKNYIFVSVGVVDSGNFKGVEEIHRLEAQTQTNLDKYVTWCRAHGLNAESRMAIDHEIVQTVQEMCRKIAFEHPRAIFFAGKLIFRRERWYHRFLHNETPFAIQRRLQFDGIQTIILPIRVL